MTKAKKKILKILYNNDLNDQAYQAIISRKKRGWDSEWNQFQIRCELFPILQSGRVKESDNFAGYDFTRSKERACLGHRGG